MKDVDYYLFPLPFSEILPISFDVLDAAITKYLPGPPGWVEITREVVTSGLVVYKLHQDQLGALGQIELRKVAKAKSELAISDPPRPPSRGPTSDEVAAVNAIPDPGRQLREWGVLMKKIHEERDRLYQRRRKHLDRVLAAFYSSLAQDPVLGKALARRLKRPRGRPGLEHDELIYRLAKAQEGEEIKHSDPSMTWKEIAREIGWRYGSSKRGVKLLEDARYRLHRLEKHDPEGLLKEVAEYRRKEKKKN